MEIHDVTMVYHDSHSDTKILFDRDEAIILRGEKVHHYNLHTLDEWVKLGLCIEEWCGVDVRKSILGDLLEMYFNYEASKADQKGE